MKSLLSSRILILAFFLIIISTGCSKKNQTLKTNSVQATTSTLVKIDRYGNKSYPNSEKKVPPTISEQETFPNPEEDEVSQNQENENNQTTNKNSITRTFDWKREGIKYRLALFLDESLLDTYKQKPGYDQNEETHYKNLAQIDPDDQSIKQLVDYFSNLQASKRLSNNELADIVVSFVQQIPYQTTEGNPKRPLKTLLDGYGDCDDKALLAHTLLKKLGYGVSLIAFERHMALGILTDSEGFGGTNFAYTEVAGPGIFPIGKIPEKRQGILRGDILLRTNGKKYHSKFS